MSHPAFLAFSPAVSRIIEITASLIRDDEEFLRYEGLLFYVEDLLSDLRKFQPRLICAEDSQLKGNPVRDSVERIRLAVYDAEDAIDSIAIEASLWKRKKQGGDFPSTHLSWGMDVRHKISQLSYELNDFYYAYKFRLPIGVDDPAILKFQRRRSAEVLVDTGVFGRDVEREKIIDLLLLDHSETVGITGEGGIGKTTVAQLVYNDKRVKKFFQSSRRWIAVTDEVNLARILAGMIDSYALSPGLVDAGSQNILPGKRFLIVLDDVELRGSEDCTIQGLLWRILDLGDKGSKVLVTSRREEVGFTLSKLPPFGLQRLPENDCWTLFQAIAFDNVTDPLRKDLEVSGKEIVARCEGYPLAVKVMGNHLRGNTDVDDWNAILRSKIWYKYGPFSNLHPALYFNYYCLASHLKQCFAFCSLFPKNYVFNKKELVKLWMAEDFIHSKGEGNEEEIGAQYFDELLDRSFFQSFKIDNGGVIYKMHDVIRDLAQSISNPDYCQIESNNYSRWSHYRHVSICGILGARSLMGFSHLEMLHTILFLSGEGFKFFPDLEDLFGSLKYIRVLDLSSSMLVELPESIGKCIMLRYLDLSNNPFKRLPRSICYLPNLQTLKLLLCTRLSRLPKNLHNLVNLRYLELDDVNWFNWPMPPKIGKLTILQNLPAFHVGLGRGYKIKELKDMASLTGSLHISRLEYAVNAREAKLNEKVRLQKLVFEWCDKYIIQEAAEKILEDLQPHQNIEELQIWNYQGTCVPTWIQNGLLQNLAVLTLKHCIKCRILSLGLLTGLRELCIKGLLELEEWTDLESPALQRLEMSDCPLIDSFPTGGLPASLQFLVIQNCPRLSERCQRETGPEWRKIAHIPDLEIDPTKVLAPALLKGEQTSSTSDLHFIGIGGS